MKNKYLFDLIDGSGRKCYLRKDNIIYIESSFTSDSYKKKYDAFLDSYNCTSMIKKVRDFYRQLQADLFSKKKNLAGKLLLGFLPYVPKIYKYGNFLDVGCNTGSFLSKLSKNWEKYGVEINTEACRLSKQFNDICVFNSPLEKFHTKLKFDFIRVSHVVEHTNDYEKFIKKLFEITKHNGYILFYTPNSRSLSYFIFKNLWSPFNELTHVYIFNIKNLEKILKKYGFKIKESGTYCMGITAGSIMNLLKLKPSNPFYKPVLLLFFILLLPFSYLLNIYKLGGAAYIYAYKK